MSTIPLRSIQGGSRRWFLARLKLTMLGHYLPLLFRGELTPRRFGLFLRRLLLFLSKLGHNKFVRILSPDTVHEIGLCAYGPLRPGG